MLSKCKVCLAVGRAYIAIGKEITSRKTPFSVGESMVLPAETFKLLE
jgi:hypothetical protein